MMIQADNLTKDYVYFEKPEGLGGSLRSLLHREKKRRRALDNFSCEIAPGEFVGLMGRNGAGKTTLIKLLTGIIRPTGGSATVCGHDPARGESAFKRKFALVMGQKSQLWWDLPASDSLLLAQSIYGIPERDYRERVDYFTDLFGVGDYLAVPVRKLSLGERMKFELIAAMLHAPGLLLLDEPTIGLDAVAQRQIRRMLRQAGRERGITLLLTSHYTEDLLELTGRCLVVDRGRCLYDGGLAELLERHSRERTLRVGFSCAKHFAPPPQARLLEGDEYRVALRVPKEAANRVLAELLALGDVESVAVEEEDAGALAERMYRSL